MSTEGMEHSAQVTTKPSRRSAIPKAMKRTQEAPLGEPNPHEIRVRTSTGDVIFTPESIGMDPTEFDNAFRAVSQIAGIYQDIASIPEIRAQQPELVMAVDLGGVFFGLEYGGIVGQQPEDATPQEPRPIEISLLNVASADRPERTVRIGSSILAGRLRAGHYTRDDTGRRLEVGLDLTTATTVADVYPVQQILGPTFQESIRPQLIQSFAKSDPALLKLVPDHSTLSSPSISGGDPDLEKISA